ncbi:MAG: hypothetical protein ABI992_06855 [Chthoniobacterales bacterium]
MKRTTLLLLSLCLATASAFAQGGATANETARFLAGLPVEGALAPLMATTAWREQARLMDEAWRIKEAQQIVPIRGWMETNAGGYFQSTGTMFYMFGGPDFLYANIFFPNASTYILAGLEPIGQVPDLTQMPPAQLASELTALRTSLSSILRFQYFITKDMRTELGHGQLNGTLPLLYVFLARLGYQIIDVAPVKTPAEGVRITFQDASGNAPQTLYYFKTNLAGGGQSAFLQWCAERGPGLSLLKAASFLLHGQNFIGVRNFLLAHSSVIVQDDSGIPLRAFPKGWDVRCYGRYVPHRTTFAKFHQPDLAAVFNRNPSSPLGFAFGYHWQKEEGMIMLATPSEAMPAIETLPVRKALPVPPEQ